MELEKKKILGLYFYGLTFNYQITNFTKLVYRDDSTIDVHVPKRTTPLNLSAGRLRIIKKQEAA